ncbi:MAG: ATP-binding protein [Armatimonadota bacterium]
MPAGIDRAIAFIDRNTRHPMTVVGLNRVRLDEYPAEALVNAVAHRQYEDAGRKVMLEVFHDRVVISSPGLPPAPITLASLRRGRYRPCSRNPVLAQCLSYFHRLEERGSGFQRMRDQMLDHGLEPPLLGTEMGYFQVTFPGPGDNLDRLRAPVAHLVVTPALEAQFNERQREMVKRLLHGEALTSRQCAALFSVTRDTVNRDFDVLIKVGIARKEGQGRATNYVLAHQTSYQKEFPRLCRGGSQCLTATGVVHHTHLVSRSKFTKGATSGRP